MSTANLLQSEYGWKLSGAFHETHLAVLLLAAQDLSAFAEAQAPGSGQIWMRRRLAPVHFHLGGLPQWMVTRVAAHAMSVVFPRQDVWLNKNFLTLPNPRQHIVHELAHVLDNRLGPKALPAAIFGGGPADRLVREMGGAARGVRYSNGACDIPPVNRWAETVGGGYGNHASAEYFAETLAWAVYYPPNLPNAAIMNWLKVNVFLAVV